MIWASGLHGFALNLSPFHITSDLYLSERFWHSFRFAFCPYVFHFLFQTRVQSYYIQRIPIFSFVFFCCILHPHHSCSRLQLLPFDTPVFNATKRFCTNLASCPPSKPAVLTPRRRGHRFGVKARLSDQNLINNSNIADMPIEND